MDTLTTFETIYRRPCKDGDEYDAFSPTARKVIASLVNHPGAIGKTKARHNRRTRRQANQALRSYA